MHFFIPTNCYFNFFLTFCQNFTISEVFVLWNSGKNMIISVIMHWFYWNLDVWEKKYLTFDISEILVLWNSGKNINISVILYDFTGILMYKKKLFDVFSPVKSCIITEIFMFLPEYYKYLRNFDITTKRGQQKIEVRFQNSFAQLWHRSNKRKLLLLLILDSNTIRIVHGSFFCPLLFQIAFRNACV